jgi:hypothetical protein
VQIQDGNPKSNETKTSQQTDKPTKRNTRAITEQARDKETNHRNQDTEQSKNHGITGPQKLNKTSRVS